MQAIVTQTKPVESKVAQAKALQAKHDNLKALNANRFPDPQERQMLATVHKNRKIERVNISNDTKFLIENKSVIREKNNTKKTVFESVFSTIKDIVYIKKYNFVAIQLIESFTCVKSVLISYNDGDKFKKLEISSEVKKIYNDSNGIILDCVNSQYKLDLNGDTVQIK